MHPPMPCPLKCVSGVSRCRPVAHFASVSRSRQTDRQTREPSSDGPLHHSSSLSVCTRPTLVTAPRVTSAIHRACSPCGHRRPPTKDQYPDIGWDGMLELSYGIGPDRPGTSPSVTYHFNISPCSVACAPFQMNF